MLTNWDLEQIADKMNLDLIGVFSKDVLPKERVAGNLLTFISQRQSLVSSTTFGKFLTFYYSFL